MSARISGFRLIAKIRSAASNDCGLHHELSIWWMPGLLRKLDNSETPNMPVARLHRRTVLVAAASLIAAMPAAWGQVRRPDPPAVTPPCIIPPELAHFDLPLPRAARRMAAQQPLKIVAIGSSSTYGEGASTPEWSYPSRLRLELAYRFPALDIAVVNRGVNGDNDYDKRGRFQRDVIAEKPDVVLWQLGTNSMLHGNPLEKHIAVLRGGVNHLRKATGADIVLIDPQYAPKVIRGTGASSIISMIAETARGSQRQPVPPLRTDAALARGRAARVRQIHFTG